jgi:hypothetical protein
MLCVWFLVVCGVCTSCGYPGSQPQSTNVGGFVVNALSGKKLLEGERSTGHPPRGFLVTGSIPAGLRGSAGNTWTMANVSLCPGDLWTPPSPVVIVENVVCDRGFGGGEDVREV